MTTRRLLVAMSVMFGLSVWSWCRGDGREAEAHPAQAAALAADEHVGEGNHEEAAMRFRTGQSVHWRHVMIGNH